MRKPMGLSRVVCKRCHERTFGDWGDEDERRWSDGWIWCPDSHKQERLVCDDAPEWCPYIAEHAVSR